MKLPKTIVIGESIWEVETKRNLDSLAESLGVHGPNVVRGLCDSTSETIYIRGRQSKFETLCTFVHEALHGISYSYGLKIPHRLVYDLEKPIAKLLIDNFLEGW